MQSGLGVGWGLGGHHSAGEQELQPVTLRGRLATRAQETRSTSRQGGRGGDSVGPSPTCSWLPGRGTHPERSSGCPWAPWQKCSACTAERAPRRTNWGLGTGAAMCSPADGRGRERPWAPQDGTGAPGSPRQQAPPRLEPPPCPLRPQGPFLPSPPLCSQRRAGPFLTGLRARPPGPHAQATGQPMALSSLDPACPYGVQTRRRPCILPLPRRAALTEHVSREQGLRVPQRRSCQGPSKPLQPPCPSPAGGHGHGHLSGRRS